MRLIRSARVAASIGTTSFSFRIIRSRSCSCTTTTSIASVNNRLQKVTVNLVFRVEWWEYQTREREKGFLTQVHLLRDLYFSAIRQEHPDRNFQSSPRRINDSDRSISPLRSAKDLKGSTMERMEWVENLDVRTFCAQGTVGVGAFIPTFTASSLPAVYLAIVPIGCALEMIAFFFQKGFSAKSSAASFSKRSSRLMRLDNSSFTDCFAA